MSANYFQSLNYTLANEDTSLELSILPEKVKHVFTVAGSGSRVIPLLSKFPQKVTCVDLSREQLALTELRVETVRSLSHEDFVGFWGYPPKYMPPEKRKSLFETLKLSDSAESFLSKYFEKRDWDSILYDGKWEKTFARLSRINRSVTGAKGLGLFTALSEESHLQYLKKKFPRKAWYLVVFLLGNATIFNALLYKGHFPKKNIPKSFVRFYLSAFDRLFKQGPARNNFFMQLLFFGKVIFSEGCPVECDPKVFEKAKAALRDTQVNYEQGDIFKVVSRAEEPIDFFSFSDVPSYFTGETEQKFLQMILPKVNKDGLIVIRNYLHVPKGLETTNYQLVTDEFEPAIHSEKVQMYMVDVYRRTV